MSAGSFDASSMDGDKRRIAHKGASSSADLFRSLSYKRESMGKVRIINVEIFVLIYLKIKKPLLVK